MVADLCEEFGVKAVQFVTDAKTPVFAPNSETGEYEPVDRGNELTPVGPLHISESTDPWENDRVEESGSGEFFVY